MAIKRTTKKTAKKAAKVVKRAARKTATLKSTPTPLELPSVVQETLKNPFLAVDTTSAWADAFADNSEKVEDLLRRKRALSKNKPTNFGSMADMRQAMLPLRDFGMQYLLSSYGIPHSTLIDIIGGEHLGKTSLMFYFMGCGLRQKCPCYYQETEGKLIQRNRALRMLSSNPVIAKKMLKNIHIERGIHSLELSKEYLEQWVAIQRDEIGVPLSTPLIVCVDTWSKLMSKVEALGNYDVGKNMTPEAKKKAKAIGEGSNFGHSTFAHEWCRRLPNWLAVNNVILILSEHQNDRKIDMGASSFGFKLPDSVLAKSNKNKVGGRAFNQNSALQLILTPAGVVKHPDKTKAGIRVNCRVDKNSYGPNQREMVWDLHTEHRGDTEFFIDEAFHFEEALCSMLITKKLLGLKVANKRYTSAILGLDGASALEVSKALHANNEVLLSLGNLLHVEGYFSLIDKIQQDVDMRDAATKAAKLEEKTQKKLEKEAQAQVDADEEAWQSQGSTKLPVTKSKVPKPPKPPEDLTKTELSDAEKEVDALVTSGIADLEK